MRFIYLITFLILTQTILSNTTYIRKINLPWKAMKLLNEEFKRWDYFNSTIPHFDSSGVRNAWEYADVIKADFNNDSKTDYAALIKPYNIEDGFLVIFIGTEGGYDIIKLKKVIYYKDRVLYLANKDSKLYNYNTEEKFVLPADGVTLAVFEKSGSTYYMVGDKFIEVITSD